MVHAKINRNGPQKNSENSRFIKRTWLSLQCLRWCVCFHYSRRIPRSLASVLEFRHQSVTLKLGRCFSNIVVQQWHLISIYIYFYYVGKICTFTLDCCSLNFLKVLQCYVYIYRTKIKVICLNMRVAMCSLSRVSNGNMIQVSRLKLKRLCKYEFYESLHSLFWFLHSWICLCECRPALKISSFTPKHHQIILYSPYCSLNIFQGTDKENLCNNQELLKLVIISFILLIIKFDPGMMWQGRN